MAAIVHDDQKTYALAARLLGRDLQALSGESPRISSRLQDCGKTCVVIGAYDTPLLRQLAKRDGLDLAALRGEWERHKRLVVRSKKQSYVLIAGSDVRGTVYGVVDLTRELGVSAWEWWADVTPRRQARVAIDDATVFSRAPSVHYRGIFLNDEDWGLQPWAAKTYDPKTGDIGPATYARIYELMWRLKANTLWPAMHDSTKPFYQIAGNPEMARDYAIVVGTSHAEPMMRNNVREWNLKANGPFNFFTNRDRMIAYWDERVRQVKRFETLMSVGLRGVHDSAMEGAKTIAEARDGVEQVIDIQRGLLSRAQGRPPERIPQVLTLYKEVLDIYKAGLKVPDDISLIWPDDNYGYISQLGTATEAKRGGGAGLYYHLSYWGRPHDYLWLGTTHPSLVREQLERAWHTGARKLWVANVGDIKPLEYLSQYFLDLAFDHTLLAQAPSEHLHDWLARQFDTEQARQITDIMMEYYALAWERRPEFMGFGQTEPTTPNKPTAYLQSGGDEALRRLDRYAAITARAEALAQAMPAERRDAFHELVLYPVRASANLNARILKLELAGLPDNAGARAEQYVTQAKAAHRAIVADTAEYNGLANGKWRHMMDMAPRRLPVFAEPAWPPPPGAASAAAATPSASPPTQAARPRAVSIAASSAAPHPQWQKIEELGSMGAVLRSSLALSSVEAGQAADVAPLVIEFHSDSSGPVGVNIVALPTHPLTSENQLRLGYRIDDGALAILDFRTHGRSDEWKLNVLSNTAVRSLPPQRLAPGKHRLRLYAMDPGFMLDRVDIVPEGAARYYGATPR
ncbi:glycosyl hydrolase 115 family protein [Duganella sp. CF517]|uniref:glycosyl hydrolase 115 family protein n=1 Tax=Duganella sp. CF517 TaxID=1881038 RepID=UPI001E2EBEF4|nr:glycosyl hydrolase 115 family protein [Duganella sp. CF517]